MSDDHGSRPDPGQRSSATIALVEDNDDVREVTSMLLAKLGYKVVAAKNGAGAIRLLEENGAAVDLLMVDFAMPEMSGLQLTDRVRGRWPALKVLIVTGYADDPAFQSQLRGEAVIKKPFTASQLHVTLEEILNPSNNRASAVGRSR
jgi:two-component system cell cycle sensor histidine kinase/response regulator CckA